jgi:hypothetical protein
MRSTLAGLALALGVVTGVQAQEIDDPQANVVEALVVSAKLPGPAWWRVSDADTTIYILGTPPALPKGMAWDKSVLERRLDGAFAVVTPSEWRAGLGDLPALLKLRKNLKDDGSWTLRSPALSARMQRAWAAADPKDREGWKDWKPLFIALRLSGKVDKSGELQAMEPEKTVVALARKHKVKARPVQVRKAMPMLKSLVREHSEAAGLACLSEVLDSVEAGPGPRRAAAQAWAEGHVKAALAGPRGAERCQLLLPGVPEAMRQSVDDEVGAITDLLKTPGHAIAVYPMRGLVAEDGVLDRLRAKGITVRTPGDG